MNIPYFLHIHRSLAFVISILTSMVFFGACGTDSSQSANDEVQLSPEQPQTPSINNLPFNNAAMDTMLYECVTAEEYMLSLQFLEQGKVILTEIDSGVSANGTYSLSGETISLNFPDLDFQESAREQQVQLGVLGTFITPSLYCYAVALNANSVEADQYDCPTSNHIQGVSFEDDEFYLRANGNVFWRHWDNLVEVNDRIYSAQNGIWIQQGSRVAMFFGSPFFEPRLMTGTLNNGKLLIDQLDTSNGPCE